MGKWSFKPVLLAATACAILVGFAGDSHAAKPIKLYDVEQLLSNLDTAINRYNLHSDKRYVMDHIAMDAKITLRHAQSRAQDYSNPAYLPVYTDSRSDGMTYGYQYPYAYMNAAYVQEDRWEEMTREGYMQLLSGLQTRIPGRIQKTSLEGLTLSRTGKAAHVSFSIRDYGSYATALGQDVTSHVMHYHKQCEALIGQNKYGLEITEMACDVMPKY